VGRDPCLWKRRTPGEKIGQGGGELEARGVGLPVIVVFGRGRLKQPGVGGGSYGGRGRVGTVSSGVRQTGGGNAGGRRQGRESFYGLCGSVCLRESKNGRFVGETGGGD